MKFDGLIMIDMWEPRPEQESIRQWYQELFCRLNPSKFKCIVNACYNVCIDYSQMGLQDRSQYNTMRIYNGIEENGIRHSKYNQQDGLLLNNLHNSRGLNVTSELIKREVLNNEHSIFLTEIQDFVHHWIHVLRAQVNDWLVVGQSWQVCVHSRSIGLTNLRALQSNYPMNFYGATWGFVDDWGNQITSKHFKLDSLPWEQVGPKGNGIYRLKL